MIVRIGDTLLVLEERPPEARLTLAEGEQGFARRLDAEIERAQAEGGAFLLVEAPFEGGPGTLLLHDEGDTSQGAKTIFHDRLHEKPAPVAAVERAFHGREVCLLVGEGVWRALVRDTTALEARPLLARLRALLEDGGGGPGLRSASFPEDGATAGSLALALEASLREGEPAPSRPRSPALRRAAGLEAAIEHAASAGPANVLIVGPRGPASGGAPLRERRDEVAALAATFIVRACESALRPDPPRLSPQALAVLEAYRWPGDLPELWAVVERAVALCAGPCIRLEHLPIERLCGADARPPPRPEAPS
ncbi:MAG TPA: hypothetical protein VFS00_08920, partial [Polyangiaceae bacterium]|nr:hypothetical protein [Polyangiaceae bacterium]